MRLMSLLRPRLSLPLGGAAIVAGFLAYGHTAPAQAPGGTIIWVYYTSLCAAPGDDSACTEIKQPVRRSFDSLEACSAYRDTDLGRAANPRVLGSCLRQHEA
jgi:hypothetical protein